MNKNREGIVEIIRGWLKDNAFIFTESEAQDLADRILCEDKPKPELMICKEFIYGESGLIFHLVPHEEGTDCVRFKCVPCVPKKAVELPEDIDENKVVFMPEVVEKYNKLIKYLKAKEAGK